MSKANKRFEKAKKIHKGLEALLLDCQEFEGSEQYNLIVDSLSRALKSINELKINAIKEGNVKNKL